MPWRTISETLRGDDAGECAELTAAVGRVCGFHSKKAADRPSDAAFRHMAFPAAEPFNGRRCREHPSAPLFEGAHGNPTISLEIDLSGCQETVQPLTRRRL